MWDAVSQKNIRLKVREGNMKCLLIFSTRHSRGPYWDYLLHFSVQD